MIIQPFSKNVSQQGERADCDEVARDFSVTIAGGIIPQQQAGSWNSRRSRPGSAVTIAGCVIPQQQAVSLELIMSL
jgi:hypothetical protein